MARFKPISITSTTNGIIRAKNIKPEPSSIDQEKLS